MSKSKISFVTEFSNTTMCFEIINLYVSLTRWRQTQEAVLYLETMPLPGKNAFGTVKHAILRRLITSSASIPNTGYVYSVNMYNECLHSHKKAHLQLKKFKLFKLKASVKFHRFQFFLCPRFEVIQDLLASFLLFQ